MVAVLAAAVLAVAPVTWLEDMLGASGPDATTFLVRRYAASATAALAVTATAVVIRMDARRAVLLGLGTPPGVVGLLSAALKIVCLRETARPTEVVH